MLFIVQRAMLINDVYSENQVLYWDIIIACITNLPVETKKYKACFTQSKFYPDMFQGAVRIWPDFRRLFQLVREPVILLIKKLRPKGLKLVSSVENNNWARRSTEQTGVSPCTHPCLFCFEIRFGKKWETTHV